MGAKCYLYDMHLPYGQVVAEYNSNGSLIADYGYGLDRISMRRGGTTYTYLADGQGSIRQLTNAGGTVTDTYDYYAFGEVLNRTGTTVNEFTYTGEQFDPNAGFYYLRARWYDPSRGRFASVDPQAGKTQDPISLHRYLYANANPVSMKDPSGEFSIVDVICASVIAVTLAEVAIPNVNVLTRFGVKRPDDDKRLTFFEAAMWWRYGNSQELNIDLSSIDLSNVSQEDFYKDGIKLDFAPVSLAGRNYSSFNDALVYGHITLSLTSGNIVFATKGYDRYDFDVNFDLKDWETGDEIVRNVETLGGLILHGPGKGFKINLIGSGTIGN